MKIKSILVAIVLIISFVGCNAQNEKNKANFPELKGPYLGQKPPGMTPEIFAPGIISNPDIKEFSITFSPNGEELFFTVYMKIMMQRFFTVGLLMENGQLPKNF